MAPHKRLGKDAMVKVQLVRLHPKNEVMKRHPNARKGDCIEYLIVQDKGIRKIRGENTAVVVLFHGPWGEHPGFECWAKESSCHVTEEADPFVPFTNPVAVEQASEAVEFAPSTFQAIQRGEAPEDSAEIPTDDDNQPVPENIPHDNDAPWAQVMGDWGHSGSCYRKKEGCQDHDAKIKFPTDVEKPSLVDVFLHLFLGKTFIDDIILTATNSKIKGGSLSRGEFLQWLGIWFLMSTVVGPK